MQPVAPLPPHPCHYPSPPPPPPPRPLPPRPPLALPRGPGHQTHHTAAEVARLGFKTSLSASELASSLLVFQLLDYDGDKCVGLAGLCCLGLTCAGRAGHHAGADATHPPTLPAARA